VRQTQTDGLTQVVLAGMGGSSLAPELFARTFGTPPARLQVIDSTTPTAVAAITADLDPARALFIISTKSGTTEETLSFFKYFYRWLAARLPAPEVGSHFVAITDPGSKLVALAEQYHFRAVFLNDPNIGGRYSALSLFGIVPAALVGASPAALLDSAAAMAARIQQADAANPALRLGALLGELALQGRDKLTLLLSPEIAGFGDWVEQLIAESTGKEGRGILPVVGEPFGSPTVYEQDRLFVRIRLADDEPQYRAFATLQDASFPTVDIILRDRDALGGQFLLWEAATALAAVPLQIQPFDQPNVEAAKVKARAMVAAYKQEGSLPSETPQVTRDGIAVYGRAGASSPRGALADFLSQAEAGDYVALQAFLPPSADLTAALQSLRMRIRDRCHLATTVGYGPRFLHSTGQLHKGDAGRGLFVQFTSDFAADLPIPDDAAADASSLSFGVLAQAQALGDRQALLDAGRRVIRFHFHGDPAAAVRQLAEAIS
jgi:glucose-6-phosphate isomerase